MTSACSLPNNCLTTALQPGNKSILSSYILIYCAYLQDRCTVPCGCCYGWFWGWNWRGCHTLLPGWMSFVVLILEQPAGCYWPWSESNCWPDHFPGRSVKEFDDKVFTIRFNQKYSLKVFIFKLCLEFLSDNFVDMTGFYNQVTSKLSIANAFIL